MEKGILKRAGGGLLMLLLLVSATGFLPAERGQRSPHWTPLGPNGLYTGSTIQSGRVDVAVSDPRDANVMYVGTNAGGGSAGGGIWKTTNYLTTDSGGPNWAPLTDDFPSLSIYGKGLALYPGNPDILYGAASGPNGGILKTTDAGAHWEYLLSDVFSSALFSTLVIHPSDPNTVYVAVRGTAPGGSAIGGVYRLTFTQAGSTWTNLTSGLGFTCVATDVAVDPTNPLVLYAGLIDQATPASQSGVYKSVDGGNTWQLLSGVLSGTDVGKWIALAMAPTSPQTVYTTIFQSGNSAETPKLERFVTTDAGVNWEMLTPPVPTTQCENQFHGVCEDFRSWHVVLSVDPRAPNALYANAHPERLFRSTDSGQTWAPLVIPEDPVNVYFDSTGTAAFVSDQGISRLVEPRSPNPVLHSKQGNLGNFLFYNVTLDPHNPSRGFGVSQDHYFIPQFNAERQWTFAHTGFEVGKVLIDPHDPEVVYTLAPVTNGFVTRSTDGGMHWTAASDGICTDDFSSALPVQLNYNAFALDERQPSRLVLGGKRVWQTLDRGDHWAPISEVLSPTGSRAAASPTPVPCTEPGEPITAIAIAPSQGDTIYAATENGGFFSTTDGGNNWVPRNQGLPPSGLVSDIAIDPSHPDHVLIQTSTVAPTGRVWMTTDAGGSWSRIDIGIPDNLTVMSLAVDWRFRHATLYAGTSRGVFFSRDLGANWELYGRGLPRTMVMGFQVLPRQNLLVAATFGRGVWRVPLALPGR